MGERAGLLSDLAFDGAPMNAMRLRAIHSMVRFGHTAISVSLARSRGAGHDFHISNITNMVYICVLAIAPAPILITAHIHGTTNLN